MEVAVRAYARLYVCDRTVLKAAMYLAVNGDGCCTFELIQHGVGNLGVRLETKGGKLVLMVMTDRGGDDAKCILNLPPIDAGL